jgi:hypothetical protein
MLDLSVDPLYNLWQQIEEEITVYEVELGKKFVRAKNELEGEMTIKKNKLLLSELIHDPFKDRSTKYEPLPIPSTILFLEKPENLTHSLASRQLICKPCTPFVPEWKETAANKVGISVQGDCGWDQRKGGRLYREL